tara:strand:+ start:717 stop:1106 length:390 start_codon:yes stop_codon:yes gene_type:complete
MTILIVENNHRHLQWICEALECNHITVKATSIKDAHEKLQSPSDPIQIVVMEIAIPQTENDSVDVNGGLEFAHFLLSDYPKMYVILFSVFGERSDIQQEAQDRLAVVSKTDGGLDGLLDEIKEIVKKHR